MKLSAIGLAIAMTSVTPTVSAFAAQAKTVTSPRPASVMMERMTTAEIRDAIRAGKTTAILPSGSTEATGPAIALGKHLVRAQYIAQHIAQELGNALVAPVMPFAPTTDESRFPGTVNLSADAFSRVNEDVAESMVRSGFKHIIFIGDHDQNQPLLRTLASRLDEKHRAEGVRVFFSSDAYAKTNKEIDEYLKAKGYPPSRHGGVSDTSLTWAANPRYVHIDRLAVGAPVPPAGSPLSLGSIGIEGDPRRASAALGKMFLDWKIKNATAEIRRLVSTSE